MAAVVNPHGLPPGAVLMHLYQIDAFTAEPFRGNPAAVCVLDAPRPDAWLQAVAAEMNLSETAFVLREGARWRLRWFTPVAEVRLCGHATLATAHALWSEGYAPHDEALYFDTRSGELVARRREGWVELDFPSRRVEAALPMPALAGALSVSPIGWYRAIGPNGDTALLELADATTVRAASPDLAALRHLPVHAVCITARGPDAPAQGLPACDLVTRFFAPELGIDEDPVTGSAHCFLAPFWAERLGKRSLVSYQASARGGIVRCTWLGERVLLSGQAVTVLRGELLG